MFSGFLFTQDLRTYEVFSVYFIHFTVYQVSILSDRKKRRHQDVEFFNSNNNI